jgi:hypothetical protein
MSKFLDVWNSGYEAIPADTEDESLGAGRIRNFKVDIRERMQQDHSWNGDDSDGYHDSATLLTQASDPTPTPASGTAGVVYSKLVGGNNELFWKDNLGNVLQITQSGKLVNPVPWAITGGLPTSIAGTNTTATISTSALQATDATGVAILKFTPSTWAVSNGNAINGFDGGTTLPNSSTIHMFACAGSSGSGLFASTSLTPTFPAGYNTYARRIYSFLTNSAGAPLGGVAREVAGGAALFTYAAQVTDINNGSAGTSAGTLFSMTVPTGFQVEWWGRIANSGVSALMFSSPDETDVAATSETANPGYDVALSSGSTAIVNARIMTNTSGQIRARSFSSSTAAYAYTRGFTDFRRS